MADEEDRPIPNSYWVIPSQYPGAENPIEAATKLRTLLSAGISHFIDLTEPGVLVPYAEIAKEEARHLGVTAGYERHPIIDLSVPSCPQQMSRVLDAIDAAMQDGKTVYVHCWEESAGPVL